MKLIEEMTVEEARAALNEIADVYGIGSKARSLSVLKTNAQNGLRRSRCLSRIEDFFTLEILNEEDDAMGDCLLNWGEEPDEYIETFKNAMREFSNV